ncbi:MAG TPA: hypothetical protein VHZ09_13570 [Acidobacteriaceae bacterium]|jgi:hypothetical protein|nr:hypothetical protein [Acidobacteriaceae bacterium]
MQATTSATANPLTKQASTAGASFWSILASTTDLAKPAGWGTVAAQSATAQQSNTTGAQTSAASDTNTGTAASAWTATTPVVQDPLARDQQELAAAVSTEAKAAAANATLAPATSNAASAAGAVQRRTSDNGKSGNNNSASSVADTVISPTVILTPQIQIPVQQLVTVPPPAVAGETQNVQAGAQTVNASAAISTQAPQTVDPDSSAPTTDASSAQSTAQIADASAQPTDPATKAASEAVNAREGTNLAVAADAKTVNHPAPAAAEFAASQLQQQTSKAAQEAAAAVASADAKTQKPAQTAAATPAPASTQQQTSAAPATTTPAGGTNAKPQPGTAKNAVAATIINVGLPQILMANAASATPAAAAMVSGVVPQFSALPDSANGIAKAGQNAVSSTASASASTSAATTATTNSTTSTNSTAANSDKSSHSSGNNDNQSQSQPTTPVANATPQHTSDAAQAVTAKAVDTGAATLQSVAHSGSSAQLASDHAGGAARTAETPRMPVPVPADTETAATSGVNAAHLIQTLGQTGMQVGMHSAEFGDISIRTLVSQQQMTAQISVDHGDLSRAIAAHVATVQTKLGDEFGLNASIQVNHGGASFSGEQGSSSAGQQRTYRTPAQTGSSIGISREVESTGPSVSVGDIDRLDIQA